jgi:hypothetical protein
MGNGCVLDINRGDSHSYFVKSCTLYENQPRKAFLSCLKAANMGSIRARAYLCRNCPKWSSNEDFDFKTCEKGVKNQDQDQIFKWSILLLQFRFCNFPSPFTNPFENPFQVYLFCLGQQHIAKTQQIFVRSMADFMTLYRFQTVDALSKDISISFVVQEYLTSLNPFKLHEALQPLLQTRSRIRREKLKTNLDPFFVPDLVFFILTFLDLSVFAVDWEDPVELYTEYF